MFKHYLLTAFNVYWRRKLYTAINLLCIVLTLMVLLVVAAILQNTFWPSGVEGKSDRFLQISTLIGKRGDESTRHSPLGYKVIELLRGIKIAERVAAVTGPSAVSVYQADRVTELQMRHADANYWQILDFVVRDGRLPNAEDDAAGRMVMVLNASSAERLFPDTRAVGQMLNVNGQSLQVIGVVEDALHLNAYGEIWAPISTMPSSDYQQEIWGDFRALLLARNAADLPRLKEAVAEVTRKIPFDPNEWDQMLMFADSKLDTFARELLQNQEQTEAGGPQLLLVIALLMLLFMLLPALNLINLNVGRILERSSEIGVRKAFGASSKTLVAQFVIENVLLTLLGGALGLAGAIAVLSWLGHSGVIPYLSVEVNFAVFALAIAIAVVFGVLSGVIPAWKMARLHPVKALRGAA